MMRSRFFFALLLNAAASLALASTAAAQVTTLPPNFDTFIDSVRTAFDVPGMAVTVVKDGRVLLAKGYGVRTLGTREKVDETTLFGIASNTKAFTAAAIAMLVEEGKLRWDAPVVSYLPSFQLSDPYVAQQLTIRDLLVHRSGLGLGAGDLLWWPPSTYDRKEIAHRLRFIPLSTSFRSAYAYDNVLYLVAGEVIEAVSGQSWEDFMASRILAHIGMRHSNVRHSAAADKGNIATPHGPIDGVVRPVRPFISDNTNPAGGINSCAEDMAKWLKCQLDSGRTESGARLFSPRTTRQLWSEVTPIPISDPPPELARLKANFNGYALGFNVRDYSGRKLVMHNGGLPGYVSKVAMLPEIGLGIAVLTNMESTSAFSAVTFALLDHFLGLPTVDWIGAYRRFDARNDSLTRAEDSKTSAVRNAHSQPSLALEMYAGTYNDAWYGDIVIEVKDGALEMRFLHSPQLTGRLEHFQYDTFIARWYDRELRADAYVTFALRPDGTIERAKMEAVSPSTDFSYDFQDLLLKPVRK